MERFEEALEDGKIVVVFTTGKRTFIEAYDYFARYYPSARVKMYSPGMPPADFNLFTAPRFCWDVDDSIYSPDRTQYLDIVFLPNSIFIEERYDLGKGLCTYRHTWKNGVYKGFLDEYTIAGLRGGGLRLSKCLSRVCEIEDRDEYQKETDYAWGGYNDPFEKQDPHPKSSLLLPNCG